MNIRASYINFCPSLANTGRPWCANVYGYPGITATHRCFATREAAQAFLDAESSRIRQMHPKRLNPAENTPPRGD